ncbi:flagellar protein [bacterium]|nr:flagellar protein [bacterium]
MNKINPDISRLVKVSPVAPNKAIQKGKSANSQGIADAKSFSEFLTDKAGPELKFSNHARKRLESRGIELSSDDVMKLQDAVKRAQDKGSKESLILSDKGAFVVSVKNGTVITAVDKGSMKENIFTNIDSTIMI